MSAGASGISAPAVRQLPAGMKPWKPGQSGNPSGIGKAAMARREAVESQDPKRVTEVLNQLYADATDPDANALVRVKAGETYLEFVGIAKGAENDGKVEKLLVAALKEMIAQAEEAVNRGPVVDVTASEVPKP